MTAARAVVFGYHDVGVRCLETLISGGVDVPLVDEVRDDRDGEVERVEQPELRGVARLELHRGGRSLPSGSPVTGTWRGSPRDSR